MKGILQRAIVNEYFRQNVVFYGGIFLLVGSILRGNEHLHLGKLIVSYPSLLFAIFILWSLHTVKITLFTLRLFNQKNYEFLYHLRTVSVFKRWFLLGYTQFLLISPTLLYSLFLIYLSVQTNLYSSVFWLVLMNLIFIFVGAWLYTHKLFKPNTESAVNQVFSQALPVFQTSVWFYHSRFLISKQPILFLLVILWAGGVMIGVCHLYYTDDYDQRLLAIGGLFVAVGFLPISQAIHQLEGQYLQFIRNLPLSFFRKFLLFITTFALLLIPTMLIFIRNSPAEIPFWWQVSLMAWIISVVALFHYLSYIYFQTNDSYMKYCFGITIFMFLLIMFKIPILLIAIVNFVVSYTIFIKKYFQYEYQPLQS